MDTEVDDFRSRGLVLADVILIGVETAKKPHGLEELKAIGFGEETSFERVVQR
jgi:hypothetical protein